jgi:hypothetical protein
MLLLLILAVAATVALGGCNQADESTNKSPVAANTVPSTAGKIPVTTSSDEARKEFLQGRDLSEKMEQQSLRLALILHCLTYPTDPAGLPIGMATIEAAIALADYFRGHAARVVLTLDRADASPARAGHSHDDAWLRRLLAAGPRPSHDVFTAARVASIGRDRTYESADRLRVRKSKQGKDGPSIWSLPDAERPGQLPELPDKIEHTVDSTVLSLLFSFVSFRFKFCLYKPRSLI